MNARENLQYVARLNRIPDEISAPKIDTWLKEVGLYEEAEKMVGIYSKGMRQRLGIAEVMIKEPELIFLDEPTIGLDPDGTNRMLDLIRSLSREKNITVFLSSHLLHEVADLCSRIAIINRGRLVAEGTLDELRRKSGLTPAYYIRVSGDAGLVRQTAFSTQVTALEADPGTSAFLFQGSGESANRLLDLLREHNLEILEFRSESEDLSRIFLTLTSQ
jgi:ABC-2 type transport system ATP-binding protein